MRLDNHSLPHIHYKCSPNLSRSAQLVVRQQIRPKPRYTAFGGLHPQERLGERWIRCVGLLRQTVSAEVGVLVKEGGIMGTVFISKSQDRQWLVNGINVQRLWCLEPLLEPDTCGLPNTNWVIHTATTPSLKLNTRGHSPWLAIKKPF